MCALDFMISWYFLGVCKVGLSGQRGTWICPNTCIINFYQPILHCWWKIKVSLIDYYITWMETEFVLSFVGIINSYKNTHNFWFLVIGIIMRSLFKNANFFDNLLVSDFLRKPGDGIIIFFIFLILNT